jgi:death-on-curing protein
MITFELVVGIHKILIKKYGGPAGVRDEAALYSAVNRPYQTFDGEELYKTSVEKAAALIESLIKNHPFIDGNKRTGYVTMRILLKKDRKDVRATEEEKYEFVIKVAEGESEYDEIKQWIEEKLIEVADH